MGENLVALKGRLKPSRWRRRPFCAHPGSMPSLVALAKRALVAALKSVARSYGVRVDLTRDAPDAAVRSTYRRVLLHGRVRRGLEVSRGGARQGLRRGRRQGSSWVESEHILRAHMGSSLGERACAGAHEKSALPLL